jgi:hypothetical protein
MIAEPIALSIGTTRKAAHLLVGVLRAGILLLPILAASTVCAQEVRVESNVQASPVNGGWYPWYELAVGPDDPDHLIVCGSRWDVHDNAFNGYVYSSSDGGRTWHTALEDRSSTWVTEHSCALGVNGKAYFLSEASKVVDGEPNHKLGTTRIFASTDAGRSWTEAIRTLWADFSASLVDIEPGPNQNRLYSFFHDFEVNRPDSSQEGGRSDASRISVLSFKDGEIQVEGPISNPKMDSFQYRGAYPEKAFLLRDGSLLAFYIAAIKTGNGLDDTVNAVRLGRERLVLADPVIVTRAAIMRNGCYPSHLAAAYNSRADTLYLAYPASAGGQCGLVLRTSADGGRTWSAELRIPELGSRSLGFFSPAMAFNNAGILGLMWRENPVSDCWYFSASRDGGKTFTPAHTISQCSGTGEKRVGEGSASLRMSANRDVVDGSSALRPLDSKHILMLNVVDSQYAVWRNAGALTATSDGVFHAVWSERGQGEGQLRTARVVIGELREQQLDRDPVGEKETRDVTQDIALLYGGDQHYDVQSSTLTVGIALKNISTIPVKGPLFIKALGLNGERGKLEIANASNRATGPGAIWELGDALPDGTLVPGATTTPYILVFHLLDKYAPAREIQVLSLQFQVLAYDGRVRPED